MLHFCMNVSRVHLESITHHDTRVGTKFRIISLTIYTSNLLTEMLKLRRYHIIYSWWQCRSGWNWSSKWSRPHYAVSDVWGMVCKVQVSRGIKGKDKTLHPTGIMGCNYLSLSLIHAPGTRFSYIPMTASQWARASKYRNKNNCVKWTSQKHNLSSSLRLRKH